MVNKGIVVRIAGVVVDVEFAEGNLPSIYNALTLERPGTALSLLPISEPTRPY